MSKVTRLILGGGGVEGVVLPNMDYIQKQGFQNKPVTMGVPPATSRQIVF